MLNLPAYNTTRGPAIAAQPGPFDFSGVSLRTFPLRADENRLRSFVDAYLDLADDAAVRYEIALPYVFLSFLNYGRMSSEATDIGIWSQNEVALLVPLEWYALEDDKWVFQDWAVLTPYIFVDNSVSIATGREVYGWPKARGWLRPQLDEWTEDETDPRRLITLQARTLSPEHMGQRKVRRDLIDVLHTPSPLAAKVPPDLEMLPFYLIPKAVVGSMGMLGTLAGSASRLVFGGSPQSPRTRLDLILEALFAGLVSGRHGHVNSVNLKQFRDIEDQSQACYQAIVNARLHVTTCRGVGLLGDVDLLRGDRTGGYEIRVRRYEQMPIVERLGLEVASSSGEEGRVVDTLRPDLPFWMDLDLRCGLGEPMCWRAGTSLWSARSEPHRPAPQGDGQTAPYAEATGDQQAQEGPFEFSNVTTRIFPLQAGKDELHAFCDRYLNDISPQEVGTFEPILPLVFMFVINYQGISADLHDIGRWADNEIMFAVPTRWTRTVDGETEIRTTLVTPFVYADSSIAIATGREVVGWPTIKCEFMPSLDAWLHKNGPLNPRRLLTVEAGVFQRLHANELPKPRVLITLDQIQLPEPLCMEEMSFSDWQEPLLKDSIKTAVDAQYPRLVGSQASPWYPTWDELVTQGWGGPVGGAPPDFDAIIDDVRELQRKKGFPEEDIKEMVDWFRDVHRSGETIHFVNLKQFRDSADPSRACYQALVHVEHEITQLHDGPLALDPDNHGESFELKIFDFPNEPIVDQLGLSGAPSNARDGGTLRTLEVPTDPFWVELDYVERKAKKLCWRAGTEKWTIG